MSEIILSPEKVQELKVRHKKERDARVCDRIKAVLLINAGYSYEQAAEILLLDDSTIRRHIEEYIASEKLLNNNKGSESKLNKAQTNELTAYLQANVFMNVKPIISYIVGKYNIRYSLSGMVTWLNEHNFTYRKPHSVPSRFNVSKQEEFIELLNKLRDTQEPLYFLDAVHPEHQSRPAHGWIYKGSNVAILTTATQKRVHIFGALSYPGNELSTIEDTTINSQSVIAMLERLKFKHPPGVSINCVLDNAKYQKSSVIQEYLFYNRNINLHYLPAYSPNLNLIERVWKFMHEHVTNNEYYQHFDNFRYSIVAFLRNLDQYKDELKTLLTFKFQKLNYKVANFVK